DPGVLGFAGVSHQYFDNPTGQASGSYPIRVTVADQDGASVVAGTSLEVDNVAPIATLSNNGPIDEGASVAVSFTGTSDPLPIDTAAGIRYSFALSHDA